MRPAVRTRFCAMALAACLLAASLLTSVAATSASASPVGEGSSQARTLATRLAALGSPSYLLGNINDTLTRYCLDRGVRFRLQRRLPEGPVPRPPFRRAPRDPPGHPASIAGHRRTVEHCHGHLGSCLHPALGGSVVNGGGCLTAAWQRGPLFGTIEQGDSSSRRRREQPCPAGFPRRGPPEPIDPGCHPAPAGTAQCPLTSTARQGAPPARCRPRTSPADRSKTMATGDAPVLEALADINAVSLERTELDPSSLILVRLAALIAVDAPASSYLLHIGPAAEAGVTLDQAQDVLVAVAPIVGTPRTASAAVKIVEALGLAIDLAESGQDA